MLMAHAWNVQLFTLSAYARNLGEVLPVTTENNGNANCVRVPCLRVHMAHGFRCYCACVCTWCEGLTGTVIAAISDAYAVLPLGDAYMSNLLNCIAPVKNMRPTRLLFTASIVFVIVHVAKLDGRRERVLRLCRHLMRIAYIVMQIKLTCIVNS